MKIFHDKFLNTVGVLATVIATIVALFAAYEEFGANKAAITVQQVSIAALVNKQAGNDQLSISFAGEPVSNFAVIQLRVENTGNVPIKSADYEGEFRINILGSTGIFFVKVKEARPATLTPKVEAKLPGIVISPMLLNPGDYFLLDIGIDIAAGKPEEAVSLAAIARVAGVSDITIIRGEANKNRGSFINFVTAFLITVIILLEFIPRLRRFLNKRSNDPVVLAQEDLDVSIDRFLLTDFAKLREEEREKIASEVGRKYAILRKERADAADPPK